jgi:polyribonucleotide nucleotidyltransferase
MLAHKEIKRLCLWQRELFKALEITKREFVAPPLDEILVAEIEKNYSDRLREALDTTGKDKLTSYGAVDALKKEVIESYPEEDLEKRLMAGKVYSHLKEKIFREDVLGHRRRPDGRKFSEIRPISCEVGWLPRVHGSSLFTRGETQAIVTVTLGTKDDEQYVDDLEKGEVKKRFMLHYNFPPYSVGETGRFGSSSRREIGHGNLARRALEAILPEESEFPYTIRIVSDITESNGSSSMASVCGGGFFKVTGTSEGITALQMDIKVGGINAMILQEALEQARKGRLYILNIMTQAIAEPREDISPYAPRIITINIHPDKIREVIGPGGKMIRSITEETGAKIDIADDGTISIATADGSAAQAAVERIRAITAEAEIGETYLGTVMRIVDFGAFVEIFPGVEGLLHISEISDRRIRDVRDELKEGQQVMVKCIGKEGNKIKLSRKAVLQQEKAQAKEQS